MFCFSEGIEERLRWGNFGGIGTADAGEEEEVLSAVILERTLPAKRPLCIAARRRSCSPTLLSRLFFHLGSLSQRRYRSPTHSALLYYFALFWKLMMMTITIIILMCIGGKSSKWSVPIASCTPQPTRVLSFPLSLCSFMSSLHFLHFLQAHPHLGFGRNEKRSRTVYR